MRKGSIGFGPNKFGYKAFVTWPKSSSAMPFGPRTNPAISSSAASVPLKKFFIYSQRKQTGETASFCIKKEDARPFVDDQVLVCAVGPEPRIVLKPYACHPLD